MMPEAMAALHARAFAGQGRGWSAEEFASLLASPHVFVFSSAAGFALGRVIADEAELLTIAVDPAQQRGGQGTALLQGFERKAAQGGAMRAFLEVSERNEAAVSLYARAGYAELSRRAGYYLMPTGAKADALILSKALC